LLLLIAGARVAAALPPEDAETEGWFSFDVGWKEGITYEYRQRIPGLSELEIFEDPEAASKRRFFVKGRIGGSLYLDGGWLGGSAVEDGIDGAVRRARLYTQGEIGYWLTTEYKLEFAVEGRRFFLNDFYLRWRPASRWVDTVKFGYFDPPAGLQQLTSSRERSLMEVAAPVAAFAPGFRVGLQVTGEATDPSLHWAFGVFSLGQQQEVGNASSDPLRLVGRLVWRPFGPVRDDAPLLHLGVSALYAFPGGGSLRFRSRPESFLAPYLTDTGDLDAEAAVVGWEAAWRDGPTSVQAEAFTSIVRPDGERAHWLWGTYAQASRILTGETRRYDPTGAMFDRVEPLRPFAPRRGDWGSVELAARAGWLDLTDGSIEGGHMLTATLGPTWTLNRWVRVLAGYVFAHSDDGPRNGSAHIAQVRLELFL
jgi:phosphate-selective porin OprO/OprP